VAHSAGVVDGSNNSPLHLFIGIKESHIELTTTPAFGHPSCSRRGVVPPSPPIHSLTDYGIRLCGSDYFLVLRDSRVDTDRPKDSPHIY